MNADDDVKELAELAYKHCPTDAEYYFQKYIGTLRKRAGTIKESIVALKSGEDDPDKAVVERHYKELDVMKKRINNLEMHLSRLRSK